MSDPKNRIRRILNIIPFVREHQGVPIEELARYCGATPSEVLADLDSILLCGVPPYLPDDYIGVYVEQGRVEIRFADHFRRPVRFTPGEALALLLAVESLPEGGDLHHEEARRTLGDKIRAILATTLADDDGGAAPPPELRGRIETLSGRGPTAGLLPARRAYLAALAVLKPAVEGRVAVEIEYYSASKDETRARRVHPLGFVDKDGELYLVAWCTIAKSPRSFRVDRIRRAQAVEGSTFEPPKGFQIERFAKQKMNFERDLRLTARVLVKDERIARWLKETRGGDLVETPSGDVIVTIRAFEMPWLLNEVLSYGPDVEVLDSEEVRQAIHEHARAMAARAATVCTPGELPSPVPSPAALAAHAAGAPGASPAEPSAGSGEVADDGAQATGAAHVRPPRRQEPPAQQPPPAPGDLA